MPVQHVYHNNSVQRQTVRAPALHEYNVQLEIPQFTF